MLKKVGEEATETVMAAKDGVPERIVAETADLWFHCLIMLAHYRLRPEQVLAELAQRAGTSGIEEKARARRAAAPRKMTRESIDDRQLPLLPHRPRRRCRAARCTRTTRSSPFMTSIRLPRCTS